MAASCVYTIGHGGRTLEEFLALLRQVSVDTVFDVRSQPYSRFQPDFCRSALSDALGQHGVLYRFMGDTLGGRPANADYYSGGKVDYHKYSQADSFREGIRAVGGAYLSGSTIALLCSERNPTRCHRSKLIGVALTKLEIPVLHFGDDDLLRTQHEVMREITGGQGTLFGEVLTSRKKYR